MFLFITSKLKIINFDLFRYKYDMSYSTKSAIAQYRDQILDVNFQSEDPIVDEALEVLKEELRSEHQWGRLAATIVIDEMEESGRKIVKDLKEVLSTRQPNKYILRVANRALNDLLGTENRVP